MIFKKTKIDSLFIIEPELKVDERGYFVRTFCKEELKKIGLDFEVAQANVSMTLRKGTVRGMHFQKEPKAEDKIVRCLKGSVYDIAIDLRPESPTYHQWIGLELTEENKKAILIPRGFAHGFQTLTDNCEMQYYMSEFYSSECAFGVRWDDPVFEIAWPLEVSCISERDQKWPLTTS